VLVANIIAVHSLYHNFKVLLHVTWILKWALDTRVRDSRGNYSVATQRLACLKYFSRDQQIEVKIYITQNSAFLIEKHLR
jgi:hypothetical protein